MTIETLRNEFAEIKTIAKEIASKYKGVSVGVCHGNIRFNTSWDNKAGIKRMTDAKKELGEYLVSKCKNRKWSHMARRGYRVWSVYPEYGGQRYAMGCGIKASLSEKEHELVLKGFYF